MDNAIIGEASTVHIPLPPCYGGKAKDPSQIKTSSKHTTAIAEPSAGDPLPDGQDTVKASGHTVDLSDVCIYEFLIQGTPNPHDLEGIEEDQLLEIQQNIQDKLKQKDEERERNSTKIMKQYEEKYYFINKTLLESVVHVTEMTKTDHPTAAAKVKSADKMVMLPPLFDGSKPEVAKQHYERFNQYIKFQTKRGNIKDPIVEAIELFEHTLDKKALVWFKEHKDKFVDVTTLKTMFLQRYNLWEKTKRDQLQPWNILTFDPQKTDVDEHIDLIDTLSDMLGQTAESKMEKFVDTMPTIIQTHLISCENWEKTTKKAKELEHIIRKCDPPAAALSTLIQGTAVLSLYSHIAHSNDKEEADIPQHFKGAKDQSKPKLEAEEKVNSHNRSQNPLQYRYRQNNTLMMILIITTKMRIIEVNPEAIDIIKANILDNFSEVKIHKVEASGLKTHTKAHIRVTVIKVIITKAIVVYTTTHVETINRVTIMANLEAEAMVMAEVITADVVMAGLIIKAITTINTISIMVMMMITSLINMAHHVHYVVAIIIPPKIVLRESMILMI